MNSRNLLSRWGVLAVVAMAAVAGGCSNKMKGENEQLWKENKELHDELASSREALEAANLDRAKLQQELADAQNKGGSSGPGGFGQLEGPGVNVQQTSEGTQISVAGDVLFDSGQATIKSSFRSKLQQIAKALNQDTSHAIRVEGHTDSDPIRKSKWRDNDHLSEARAQSVRDYLASQGVDKGRMETVGYGSSSPVADNNSKSNKAKNRRVEIIVLK